MPKFCPLTTLYIPFILFFLYIPFIYIYILRFYLFILERHRERQRHRQREKQAPYREPNVGLDPRFPGSCPGLKAETNC